MSLLERKPSPVEVTRVNHEGQSVNCGRRSITKIMIVMMMMMILIINNIVFGARWFGVLLTGFVVFVWFVGLNSRSVGRSAGR